MNLFNNLFIKQRFSVPLFLKIIICFLAITIWLFFGTGRIQAQNLLVEGNSEIQGTAKVGLPGNGNVLLDLNSERSWVFRQLGMGAETWLELASIGGGGNKNFLINTTGKVGIGTLVPDGKLSVDGEVGIGSPSHTLPSLHMLDIASTKGSQNNSAIRAFFPAGGGLTNTEFGALAYRQSQWNAIYAKQGSASTALYTDGEVNLMNGNVGIGTTNPEAKTDILFNSSTSTPHILLRENNIVDFARISFENTSSSNFWTLAGMTSGNHPISEFNLFYNGYGNILSAKGNGDLRVFGRLGINKTTPEYPLHVLLGSDHGIGLNIESPSGTEWGIGPGSCPDNGGFHAGCLSFTRNGTPIGALSDPFGWLEYSDISLKKNLVPIDQILDKLLDINIWEYNFIQQENNDPKSVGVIAQELEKIFPEFVFEVNGKKSVAYNRMGIIAIKAIQEQQEIIEELLEKNNELEERLDDFQKQLDEVRGSVLKSRSR